MFCKFRYGKTFLWRHRKSLLGRKHACGSLLTEKIREIDYGVEAAWSHRRRLSKHYFKCATRCTQMPWNAHKHRASAGCNVGKNVVPNVTPNVAPW